MKNIIFTLFILAGITGYAQEISIDLDNFTEIEVSNGLKVNLIKSEENKAIISGNSRDKVEINQKDGVIKVQTSLNHIWNEDNTIVNIYYKQLLRVEARQNADVELCGKIFQPIIEFKSAEGSDIYANIEVENFIARSITGGNLVIIGSAIDQIIDLKASGDFKGENLIGETVDISLSAGGKANVYGKKYVKATVTAGGTIYVYGKPEKLDKKTTFGGTIKKIK